MFVRRSKPLYGLASVAIVLSACAGDDEASTTGSSPIVSPAATGAGTSAPDAAFNDADVAFVRAMIPHHEGAVRMAEMALDPERQAGPEVIDLATRIRAAQQPEIDMMSGWLEAWSVPTTNEGEHDMGSMSGSSMPMDDATEDMASMTGDDFDHLWLEAMIEHHRGAIEMAEQVQAGGKNHDVRRLADEIIAAQQAEIDEMTPLAAG